MFLLFTFVFVQPARTGSDQCLKQHPHRNGNQSSGATAPSKIKRKKNLNSIFLVMMLLFACTSPPPLTLVKSFLNGSLMLPAHCSKIESFLQLRTILNKHLTKSNINSILLNYYYFYQHFSKKDRSFKQQNLFQVSFVSKQKYVANNDNCYLKFNVSIKTCILQQDLHSEPCQPCRKELLANIVNGFQSLTFLARKFI